MNALNDFEKKFYKDLLNSLFGKSIENQRKYSNIKLIHENRLEKYVAKTTFKESKSFENGLHAVHLNKVTVKIDKPKYLGMSILDISPLTIIIEIRWFADLDYN